MAVVNLKSVQISNRDSLPKIFTDAFVDAGYAKGTIGSVQTGAADSVGSVYRLIQVPSNARLSALDFVCDAAGGAVDIGAYYPTYVPKGDGKLDTVVPGSVINQNFFAAAQSAAAVLKQTSVLNASGYNTISKQEMTLWAALGMAQDPGILLDICLTVTTAMSAAGFIGLKATYISQ